MHSRMGCVFSTGTALFRLNHWFLTSLKVQLNHQTVTPVLILLPSYSFALLHLCGRACYQYSGGLAAHLRGAGPAVVLEGVGAS